MSVLFVDTDNEVLEDLEHQLAEAEAFWNCEFALGSEEAYELLSARRFDAIVTALRLSGASGTELVGHARHLNPDIVRIVWSEPEDRDHVHRLIDASHLFLPRPCSISTLTSTIQRAICVRDLISSTSIKRLLGGIGKLPSVPAVYQELTSHIRNNDASIAQIGEIVSRDAAMTAKVLQLVNSAIYCLEHHVSDPVKAVSLLGASTLKSLVLAVGIFQEFDQLGFGRAFSVETLMQHCLRVSRMTKSIGQSESMEDHELDDAITAATLHDIGKLVLHAVDPESYDQAQQYGAAEGHHITVAERAIFGCDHAAVGAYLLNSWGLPQSIVEMVALHHAPTKSNEQEFAPLTAVVSANFICSAGDSLVLPTPDDELLRYLEMVACGDKLVGWQQLSSNLRRQNGERGSAPVPHEVSM